MLLLFSRTLLLLLLLLLGWMLWLGRMLLLREFSTVRVV
jgi:hypothetical protein